MLVQNYCKKETANLGCFAKKWLACSMQITSEKKCVGTRYGLGFRARRLTLVHPSLSACQYLFTDFALSPNIPMLFWETKVIASKVFSERSKQNKIL